MILFPHFIVCHVELFYIVLEAFFRHKFYKITNGQKGFVPATTQTIELNLTHKLDCFKNYVFNIF